MTRRRCWGRSLVCQGRLGRVCSLPRTELDAAAKPTRTLIEGVVNRAVVVANTACRAARIVIDAAVGNRGAVAGITVRAPGTPSAKFVKQYESGAGTAWTSART